MTEKIIKEKNERRFKVIILHRIREIIEHFRLKLSKFLRNQGISVWNQKFRF